MISKLVQKLSNGLIFSILLGLSIANVFPLFFIFYNSIKSRTDYLVSPFSLLGDKLTWNNYATMISQFRIINLFRNSFIISFFTIFFILCFGIVASYAFAKLKFTRDQRYLFAGYFHDVHSGPGDHHPGLHFLIQNSSGKHVLVGDIYLPGHVFTGSDFVDDLHLSGYSG